jgi:ATP-dependent RNA helicase DDX60
MAPPEGSIFDPVKKWEEEKARRRKAQVVEEEKIAIEKKNKSGNKKGGAADKKMSSADTIKLEKVAEKIKEDHERDLQKLSNLHTLRALQEAACETFIGKTHRIMKMLHLAASDLKKGAVNATEAEVLDILWALEEMESFKSADNELKAEKAAKKDAKDDSKKDSKKDSKNSSKNDTKTDSKKVVLSPEANSLKTLFNDKGHTRGFKDSLKYARKLMSGKENLFSFQLTDMADRLPPLSRYNRTFQLEDWQCSILEAIDNRTPAIVCAPTSSGKTLLSLYTCKNVKGTVLFVVPSEVLVWQVASTYYQFFKGNVTVCTDLITFQEVSGNTQIYIGTPKALEKSISKVRGIAGDEMTKGKREFMILDGGYKQFEYLVLDEVHTLNGPEGDALQRIIKACDCPFLALSAAIGNAEQLRSWFQKVHGEHIEAKAIDAGAKPEDVVLEEHYAHFIHLQRYVFSETIGKDGKTKPTLSKLHPVAAMTPKRLHTEPELIEGLSMTPSDLMDLWKRMRSTFPSTILEELDDPEKFFRRYVGENRRVTLNHTREYEKYIKKRLTILSHSHRELFERLRAAHLPPVLEAKSDVSDSLYGVIEQLKEADLLPAVAFN